MTLAEFVPPRPHLLWTLCRQMGIEQVVVKVNPDLTGMPDPWKLSTLEKIVGGLRSAGLAVVGLEGDPFDLSAVKQFGEEGITARMRDEALERYRELLGSMAKLGIRLLCYNFMVGTGWARTGVREGRGGARSTCFSLAEAPRVPLRLTQEQVWANYECFLKAVMPTAERLGVRMGLHPDDPCLPELGGHARIFGTIAAFDRAYEIYPSESNAVTFCQANFKLMSPFAGDTEDRGATRWLCETAKHFGRRIAFIHVRDVEGDRTDFTELFHDQGTTDQFALMRTYRALGLDVPIRGDHVPEMEGDRVLAADGIPGYFTLGRLFADGYLKALLRGTASGEFKRQDKEPS